MKKMSILLIAVGLLMVLLGIFMPRFTTDEASIGVWKMDLILGVVMTVVGTVYLLSRKK